MTCRGSSKTPWRARSRTRTCTTPPPWCGAWLVRRCGTSRWCSGAATSRRATRRSTHSCAGRPARSTRRDLAMRMWGEGDPPQISRLEAALALARRAAAVAPRTSQPGALAMCAWLSWALGRSTHAAAYAERACEIEPEHGLSQIVLSFVSAGHLPDWAFRRAGAAVTCGGAGGSQARRTPAPDAPEPPRIDDRGRLRHGPAARQHEVRGAGPPEPSRHSGSARAH